MNKTECPLLCHHCVGELGGLSALVFRHQMGQSLCSLKFRVPVYLLFFSRVFVSHGDQLYYFELIGGVWSC